MAEPPQREHDAWDGFAEPCARTRAALDLSILEDGQLEGVIVATPTDVIDAKSLLLFAVRSIGWTALLAETAGATYYIYRLAIGTFSKMSMDPLSIGLGLVVAFLYVMLFLILSVTPLIALCIHCHRSTQQIQHKGWSSLLTRPGPAQLPFELDHHTLRLGSEAIELSQVVPANSSQYEEGGKVYLQLGLRDGSQRELECDQRKVPRAAMQWLHSVIVQRSEAFGSPDDIPESLRHMRESSTPGA